MTDDAAAPSPDAPRFPQEPATPLGPPRATSPSGSVFDRPPSRAGAIPPSPPTAPARLGSSPTPPVGVPPRPVSRPTTTGAVGPLTPPSATDTAPTSTTTTGEVRRRGGWWKVPAAFVAGGLVAAGGFAAARATEPEPTVVTETAATGVDSGVAAAPAQPPIQLEITGDEPVTAVAQLLGPAVVQIETNAGLGSGVSYDATNGYILTNHHVIAGATQIQVRASDGRTFEAEVIGSDPTVDIAVVSVGADAGLPEAQLAVGEPVEVGQLAVAIGSPFQLQQTVTAGIVSAVNRPVQDPAAGSVVAMIQTDAPINPGNSGGALADRAGRVIGINTSIRTDGTTGTNAGVGFAVPIDTAFDIADRIVNGIPLDTAFLGVRAESEITDDGLGVAVGEITAGSAAEAAGIQVGDRILRIDGAPVSDLGELAGLVRSKRPGSTVSLDVLRGGEEIVIEAVLGQLDE